MPPEKDLIYFVTGNHHKFEEVLELFQENDLNHDLKHLKMDTLELQADSIKDVALFKLNSVKDKVDGSFFVEDAGFFVDRPLNGFPGVYSSYVYKTIGNEGILKLINDNNASLSHFSALIALYYKPLNKVFTFEGQVNGSISEKISGSHGFGFDPIFIPEEFPDKTFAELPRKVKNKISHRGIALKKLISFLKNQV